MTDHASTATLDTARVLRPEGRDRLRTHFEGQVAHAKQRGLWRDHRDGVLGLVLLATGIRVGEACALRRSDVRVGRGEREILIRRGKGGRKRTVRIPNDLRGVLRDYLDAFASEDPEAALFTGGPDKPVSLSRSTAPACPGSVHASSSRRMDSL
jgi:integrase